MRKLVLSLALMVLMSSHFAQAQVRFTGQNYSGEYLCKGKNEMVGDYEVYITLKLNKISSHGRFGVYDFSTETENKELYSGQAIANGPLLAMTFKLSEAKKTEFSTGVAELKKIGKRKWAFQNSYYEPDDSGGNYGVEYCAMEKAYFPPVVKATKKAAKPLAKAH